MRLHTLTLTASHTHALPWAQAQQTQREGERVKGHPGRGQIRTLGFFSVGQADIPSHIHTTSCTHTFSTPAILLLCSAGQAGSRWATARACLKEQDHVTQEPQAKQIFTCTKSPHQRRLMQTNCCSSTVRIRSYILGVFELL